MSDPPKPETQAAEVRRGKPSRTVSERGRVSAVKRRGFSKIGRNFVNLYIITTGVGTVYMTSTSLPGDFAIHGAWLAGTISLSAYLTVWWLEMRKRE